MTWATLIDWDVWSVWYGYFPCTKITGGLFVLVKSYMLIE